MIPVRPSQSGVVPLIFTKSPTFIDYLHTILVIRGDQVAGSEQDSPRAPGRSGDLCDDPHLPVRSSPWDPSPHLYQIANVDHISP